MDQEHHLATARIRPCLHRLGAQEFAIAGALSGDGNMLAAYLSGDSYLAFAKQARAIPEDATKQSHPSEREQFKQCILATQYGMGSRWLAIRIGQPEFTARGLLQRHKKVYRRFWQWSDNRLDHASWTAR